MMITEIILTASEFHSLITTLEAGIRAFHATNPAPEEQRREGIALTGVLKKMAAANALYTIRRLEP